MTVATKVLLLTLVGIAAASLVAGLSGAQFISVPFNITVVAATIAVVVWTRRPTAGLIVAAWLSLGWLVMPEFTVDHLRDPKHQGVFVGSLLQLLATAAALASGAVAEREYRKSMRSAPGRAREQGAAR
jgi:hypothetical protein